MANVATAMPWKKPAGKPAEVPNPLQAKVDELGKIKAELSPLKKREKELVDEIGELGAGEFKGTKCLAVVTVTPGERFDAKSFKTEYPEVAAKFTVDTETTKVVIKPLF